GTTVVQLSQANSLGKTPVLKVGLSLIIPMSGVTPPPPQASASTRSITTSTKSAVSATTRTITSYTVRAGDTLGKIAARFNTTVDKLKSLNNLTTTRLAVGKKLEVSAAPAQAASNLPAAKKVIHQAQRAYTLHRIDT